MMRMNFFTSSTLLSKHKLINIKSFNIGIDKKLRLYKLSMKKFFVGTKVHYLKKEKDYYRILEVSHDSSLDDIKKSYYKLAKEYHPDLNNSAKARELFPEINEAFDVLSDQTKRELYDYYILQVNERIINKTEVRKSAIKKSQKETEAIDDKEEKYTSPLEISNMRDLIDDFPDYLMEEDYLEKQYARATDIIVDITLNIHDYAFGCNKEVSFNRTKVCFSCNGSARATKTAEGEELDKETCYYCLGKGVTKITKYLWSSEASCKYCSGTGKTVKTISCNECSGMGLVKEKTKEVFSIPSGIDESKIYKKKGLGNMNRKGETGDLLIKIERKNDVYFVVKGKDIYTENYISLANAYFGGKVIIKTIHGDKEVALNKRTQDNEVLNLPGLGIKNYETGEIGNHFVKIKILLPNENDSDLNYALLKYFEETKIHVNKL